MKKTIFAITALLIVAASCKKNDDNKLTTTTTASDSTHNATALTGNWIIVSQNESEAYVDQEITFYDQDFLVLNNSAFYVTPYSVSHDTLNGVGQLMSLYTSITGINYCKYTINGDTAYLKQFGGSDSITLAKIY